jgi:hypothetical protein
MTIKDATGLNEVTVSSDVQFDHLSSPPSLPTTDSSKLYIKNDGNVYTLDELGTERLVGDDSGDIADLQTKTQNLSVLTAPNATLHNGEFQSDTVSLTESLQLTEQLGTPAAPPIGEHKLYFRGDTLYTLDENGIESAQPIFDQGLNSTNSVAFAGVTSTADIDMTTNKVVNVGNPTLAQDATTKQYTDSTFVKIDGTNAMTGNLDLGSNDIINATSITTADLTLNNDNIHLGNNAGQGQGLYSVAIGRNCADSGQLTNSVGIGHRAAESNQGSRCTAVGERSGCITQGNNSTCIGAQAGETNCHIDSVLINAGSDELNSTATQQIKIRAGDTLLQADQTSLTYNSNNVEGDFKADGTVSMSANLDAGTNKVIGVVDPTLAQDAATKNYVDTNTANNNYLLKSGGTMAGSIDYAGFDMTNVKRIINSTSIPNHRRVIIGNGNVNAGLYGISLGEDAGEGTTLGNIISIGKSSGLNKGSGTICIGGEAGFNGSASARMVCIGEQAGRFGNNDDTVIIGQSARGKGFG